MVVTIFFWVQSWTVLLISLGILLVIIPVLVFCVCFGEKRKAINQYFIFNSNKLRDSGHRLSRMANNSLNVLRRYSLGGQELKPGEIYQFTSETLPIYKVQNDVTPEIDFQESFDISETFNNATLRMDNGSNDGSNGRDEALSCISKYSYNSFKSAYPPSARSKDSEGEIYSTVDSDSDVYN